MNDRQEKLLNDLVKLKNKAEPLLLIIEYYNAVKALKEAENLIKTLKDGHEPNKGVLKSMTNNVKKLENQVNVARMKIKLTDKQLEEFVETLLKDEMEKGKIQKSETKVIDDAEEFLNHLVGIKSYVKETKNKEPGFIYGNFSEYEDLKKKYDALENPSQEIKDIMDMLEEDLKLAKERENNPTRSEDEENFYKHIVEINSYVSEQKIANPDWHFDNVSEVDGLLKQLEDLKTSDKDILAIMDTLTKDIKKEITNTKGDEEAKKYQEKLDRLLKKDSSEKKKKEEKEANKQEPKKEEVKKPEPFEGKRLTDDYKHEIYEMVKVPIVGAKKSLNRLPWVKAYHEFINKRLAKKQKKEEEKINNTKTKVVMEEPMSAPKDSEIGDTPIENEGVQLAMEGFNEITLHPKDNEALVKNIDKVQAKKTSKVEKFFESLRDKAYKVHGGPDIGDKEKAKSILEQQKEAADELNPINQTPQEEVVPNESTEAEKEVVNDATEPEKEVVNNETEAEKEEGKEEKSKSKVSTLEKTVKLQQDSIELLSKRVEKLSKDNKEILKIVRDNKIDEKKTTMEINSIREDYEWIAETLENLNIEAPSLDGKAKVKSKTMNNNQ